MSDLRFAVFGAGFWPPFQLAGWRQAGGAECVAIYNRTRSKAEALAEEFAIPAVYDDAQELLRSEELDFVDVITAVETHADFVRMVADRGLPVICQKPMAVSLQEAEETVAYCAERGVPLFVHENWRWQTPLRGLKEELGRGAIGKPFRAHVLYLSSLRVWEQQPFLKELDQFILTDMGSHILDVARFLFGEAASVCCHTNHVSDELKGEDNATVMMQMRDGMTVICEISYASITERERPFETYVTVEGERGSVELGPDCVVRTTTREGTVSSRHVPEQYAWSERARDVVNSGIVPCNANLLAGIAGTGRAETTGEDNLETVRLVFASYESARTGQAVQV